MFTTLLAIKILGVAVTVEQLVAAGFFGLFLGSEYLGSNKKISSNAVYQLLLSYLKSVRTEDDAIKDVMEAIKKERY